MVTLNVKRDFDRVYKSQRKWHSPYFIMFFQNDSGLLEKRVGFSVSKKIGNAVCRNLIKRRLRHIYRESMPYLRNGDMVLLAKSGLDRIAYKTLLNDYRYALKRLDLVI